MRPLPTPLMRVVVVHLLPRLRKAAAALMAVRGTRCCAAVRDVAVSLSCASHARNTPTCGRSSVLLQPDSGNTHSSHVAGHSLVRHGQTPYLPLPESSPPPTRVWHAPNARAQAEWGLAQLLKVIWAATMTASVGGTSRRTRALRRVPTHDRNTRACAPVPCSAGLWLCVCPRGPTERAQAARVLPSMAATVSGRGKRGTAAAACIMRARTHTHTRTAPQPRREWRADQRGAPQACVLATCCVLWALHTGTCVTWRGRTWREAARTRRRAVSMNSWRWR